MQFSDEDNKLKRQKFVSATRYIFYSYFRYLVIFIISASRHLPFIVFEFSEIREAFVFF